jgi:hypothetical protein
MPDKKGNTPLSSASWLALGILVGFLAVVLWYGIYAWDAIGEVHISGFGWVALIAGSVLTIAVGGGLMALVFYSNRNNFDR